MITDLHLSNLKEKHQHAPLALACTALLALLCSGCAEWKWRYQPDPPVQRAPVLTNTVAVPNLSDERSPYKTPDLFPGFLLALLPGVLYQTQEAERIEQSPETQMKFHPTEDIAQALADELRNYGLFKGVLYSQKDTEGDLILRGRLTSTYINRTLYQYGITVSGAVYLSMLGPPIDKMHMTLAFTIQLEEPQTQTTLWQKDYKKEREFYRGLWYGPKEGDIQYDSMLKELMPQILADLEQALKGITTASAESTRGQ